MKTKEQILEWLDKQPWKGEFYEEVFLNGNGNQIPYNELFIIDAFCWHAAKSSVVTWGLRHKAFLAWYNNYGRPATWKEFCNQNPIIAEEFIKTFRDLFRCRKPGDIKNSSLWQVITA